jgi:hypothetical protein
VGCPKSGRCAPVVRAIPAAVDRLADGIVQLIASTADLIMVRNAHRRRPKPPIVRPRCPSLGETVVSFAFDCQQTIEITPQCCWRAKADEDGHYCFAVAL